MAKPNKTPGFDELQAVWDKKLAESGFKDAEQRSDGNLKDWDSLRFQRWYGPEEFRIKAEYYQAAGRFLHDYEFKSDIERQIWALHADGVSIRDILAQVKSPKIRSSWKVNHILMDLAKEMKRLWKE